MYRQIHRWIHPWKPSLTWKRSPTEMSHTIYHRNISRTKCNSDFIQPTADKLTFLDAEVLPQGVQWHAQLLGRIPQDGSLCTAGPMCGHELTARYKQNKTGKKNIRMCLWRKVFLYFPFICFTSFQTWLAWVVYNSNTKENIVCLSAMSPPLVLICR